MLLAPGTVVGGKYRLERPLARGGMGSVWVATHVQLGASLAIKFLDPTFAVSPAHRARFEREARASAALKSPHVVHVQDYGFEGDAPYLVMELLEGEDLAQRLHRVKRMSLHDTAKLLAHVGKALRKAHEAGIAHRDLKPANLFLARVDDDEIVKVLDFGIAKDAHAALGDATRTGEVIGSPHYMSPEQVRAEKDLDYRTDLWSLAIILFRVLVGSLPFPGDQLGPVLAKILTDPLPVPSHLAPDLPPSIDGFFARALMRDKAQRFQSIGEMVQAFQLAADGKEAFPSISMSLGTGSVPAGAAAPWSPHGPATGSITGSAVQLATDSHAAPPTGPVTGTTGGLASTGSAKPRSATLAVAVALVAVALAAGAAAGIAFFVLRSPPTEPAPAAGAAPAPSVSATTEASAATAAAPAPAPPSVVPSASVSAPSSAEPAPSASASATAAAAKPVTGPRPKPTSAPVPTREKWF